MDKAMSAVLRGSQKTAGPEWYVEHPYSRQGSKVPLAKRKRKRRKERKNK